MAEKIGRTLILIKPDAIERRLTGEIIRRFERKGFRIVKAEMRLANEDLAKEHYAEHVSNPKYFKQMIEAITHGPVIAMILEGPHAIEGSRQLIGNPSPHHSHVGTIRGDLAYEEAFNLVHGSDSYGSADREINLWFGENETTNEMLWGKPLTKKHKCHLPPMPPTFNDLNDEEMPMKKMTLPAFNFDVSNPFNTTVNQIFTINSDDPTTG